MLGNTFDTAKRVAAEFQVPARPINGGVRQQRGDKANEERQRGEGVLWRCPLRHCTREVTRTGGTRAMSRQQRSGFGCRRGPGTCETNQRGSQAAAGRQGSTRYGLTINDGTQRWFIFLFPSTPSKWFTFSIYTTKTNDFQILTIFSPLHAIPKRGGVMEPDPEEESNPGFRSQD